jgi:hypothetical protein
MRPRHRPGTAGLYTPIVPPGEEIEVTALWDIRGWRGEYVITVTADASGRSSRYVGQQLGQRPRRRHTRVDISQARARMLGIGLP